MGSAAPPGRRTMYIRRMKRPRDFSRRFAPPDRHSLTKDRANRTSMGSRQACSPFPVVTSAASDTDIARPTGNTRLRAMPPAKRSSAAPELSRTCASHCAVERTDSGLTNRADKQRSIRRYDQRRYRMMPESPLGDGDQMAITFDRTQEETAEVE